MHDHYMLYLGRWAGENIVYIGEYIEPGNYPFGLFLAEEVDKLSQRIFEVLYNDDYPDEIPKPPVPFTLYYFSEFYVLRKQQMPSSLELGLLGQSSPVFSDCMHRAMPRGDAACRIFQIKRKELAVTEKTYYSKDEPWILRNQTTKEFVRSEAIALKPEYIRGLYIDVLGFGHVVMSRICWSTSLESFLDNTPNISRGVWVGHCLDITTVARHMEETKGGVDWKDVSEEVASEIAVIWEEVYGPNWRVEIDPRRRRGRGSFV